MCIIPQEHVSISDVVFCNETVSLSSEYRFKNSVKSLRRKPNLEEFPFCTSRYEQMTRELEEKQRRKGKFKYGW